MDKKKTFILINKLSNKIKEKKYKKREHEFKQRQNFLLKLNNKRNQSPIKDLITGGDGSIESPFLLKLDNGINNFISHEYTIIKHIYGTGKSKHHGYWIKNQTFSQNSIPMDILDVWYIGDDGAMETIKIYFDLTNVFGK